MQRASNRLTFTMKKCIVILLAISSILARPIQRSSEDEVLDYWEQAEADLLATTPKLIMHPNLLTIPWATTTPASTWTTAKSTSATKMVRMSTTGPTTPIEPYCPPACKIPSTTSSPGKAWTAVVAISWAFAIIILVKLAAALIRLQRIELNLQSLLAEHATSMSMNEILIEDEPLQ